MRRDRLRARRGRRPGGISILPLVLCAVLVNVPGCSYLGYDIKRTTSDSKQKVQAARPTGILAKRVAPQRGTVLHLELRREIEQDVVFKRKIEKSVDFEPRWGNVWENNSNDDWIGWVMFGVPDLAVLMLSSIVMGPAGMVAGLGGSSEQMEGARKVSEPLANSDIEVRVPKAGFTTRVATGSSGSVGIDLAGPIVRLLEAGHASATLTIKDDASGADGTFSLGSNEVVELANAAFSREGSVAAGWWRVKQAMPTDAVSARRLADAALARLGARVASTDAAALELFAGGTSDVLLADGTRIDWSEGRPSLPPFAVSRVSVAAGSGRIHSGEPLELDVAIENRGKGALVRLRAETRSATPSLDGIPIVIGRIEPGQSVRRQVVVPTSPSMPAGDHDISIEFSERNGYGPRPVGLRFRADAALRPAFAFSVQARDDGTGSSIGNGDQRVQRGEAIELRMLVRNVGTVEARGVEIALELANTSGIDFYGDRSHTLGDMAAGQEAEIVATVAVKPSFEGEGVPLLAVIRDRRGLVDQREDLSLSVDAALPERVIALDRSLRVAKASDLLSSASDGARRVGQVDAGSGLRATGQQGDFYRIEYLAPGGSRREAWIARDRVQLEQIAASPPGPKAATRQTAPAPVVQGTIREFVNAPPFIAFVAPAEGIETETGEEQIRIRGVIKDDSGVAGWSIERNGEEIASIGARGIQARGLSGSQRVVQIDREVQLLPGRNHFVIRARDDDGDATDAEAIVVRAVRVARVTALVIGIDDYDDPNIPDLAYAEADARAFADFLLSPASPVREPESVKLLLGREATVVAIKSWIERVLVRGAVHEEDMAIFYFAGHGYTDSSKTYLAGFDTYLNDVRATGFSASELREYWNDIKAGRRVLVADACHAGGLSGARGGNEVSSGLAGTLSARGTVSFMASTSRQLSVESAKLGHGVFTWSLLEGLKGSADRESGNRDGRVSAKELATWLDREVPALARSEGGRQTPSFRADTDGTIYLTR